MWSPSPWRLVLGAGDQDSRALEPARGARNMAVDQALLESVAAGAAPVLRFYRWHPACLSFGRNQTARGLYDPARAATLGIDVVRRPTGGLAVLHDAELTYSVIAPASVLGGPRAAYCTINQALAAGLRSLGVNAELAAGARRETAADAFAAAAPCFELPAAGEVVVGGRKLIGSAQRVERRTILQHGSILVDGSQEAVQQIQAVPGAAPVHATTLRQLLGRSPGWNELALALENAFARTAGTALAPAGLKSDELDRAARLTARFADHDWTWRR